MPVGEVQPLRISKGTPSSSPAKPGPTNMPAATSRPLAELGSGERRRNSPSYNQATRKMIVSRDPSPFSAGNENADSSPFTKSPRDFWTDRMSAARFGRAENSPEPSPSPSPAPALSSSAARRSSIEDLKKASRVKNSSIFALESRDAYDPASLPVVNRPLSQQLTNNSFARFDSLRKENKPLRSPQRPGHKRSETEISVPVISPSKVPLPCSPEKRDSPSPTKSNLVHNSQFGYSPGSDPEDGPSTTKSNLARNSQFGYSPGFDPQNGTWSDEDRVPTPRALHRHAKSVTFHNEPPVVNEYEQQTPEPSSVASGSRDGSYDSEDFNESDISIDRGSSADLRERDGSFDGDLEDAGKTPVVLPEHWMHMSPEHARTDLVDPEDDVFASSPDLTQRPILGRSESVTSDGEARPLPPLPPGMLEKKIRRDSAILAAAAERASLAHRSLPSPPKRASCSKDEILQMGRESSLNLSDRLQLKSNLDHADGNKTTSPVEERHSNLDEFHAVPEELTITNLDTGAKEAIQVRVAEAEVEEDDSVVGDLLDYPTAPPRISRESILRKVKQDKYAFEDEDDAASDAGSACDIPERIYNYADLDPDVAIPSRENSRETGRLSLDDHVQLLHGEDEREAHIKPEPTDDDGVDVAALPPFQPLSRVPDPERQSSVLHHRARSLAVESEDDASSRYSSPMSEPERSRLSIEPAQTIEHDGQEQLHETMGLLTVKDYSSPKADKAQGAGFMGLPVYQSTAEYDFDLSHYNPPPPQNASELALQSHLPSDLQPILALPRAPYAGAETSPPGTPTSVIHSPRADPPAQPRDSSPGVPERKSTIRTSGKLKARPSATPADFQGLALLRRPSVPVVPKEWVDGTEQLDAAVCADEGGAPGSSGSDGSYDSTGKVDSFTERHVGNKVSGLGLGLDIPIASPNGENGLGLDREFDRVLESQKNGYLTRHNTKLVVASSRDFSGDSALSAHSNEPAPMSPTTASPHKATRSARASPRKPSAEQVLKTEPWNGKVRRKSVRNTSRPSSSGRGAGPAPPLPGQESALGVVNEDYATEHGGVTGSLDEEVAEGVERGRLFVKVVAVHELDLPMPKDDRIYFQLTLDNGLHCVTTAELELGRTAPIGQEFELVVLNDLEFQLTLTTQLPPPPALPTPVPSSPTKSLKSHKPAGAFSRLLSSPKKRAERERREREEAEAEERARLDEAQRKRATLHASPWDLLHDLVNASDGSFARAYINLRSHEHQCFGRHVTVDVPCYNEWATEQDRQVVHSVRSKRGNGTPVRRPPYIVGKLALQLLYVPKPRAARETDLPKSMSAAVREMARASEATSRAHEGHLSQQGGDCAHWRRRFFRLDAARLTAYHEHTGQKRAVINLAKASRLVDGRGALVGPGGGASRRKSAFAEEDEGYQYVEEGFRLRFANGETIDFYADSRAEKEGWMQALGQLVGKGGGEERAQSWTDLVLARERLALRDGGKTEEARGLTKAPPSPMPLQARGGGATEVRDFTKPPPPPLRKPSAARDGVLAAARQTSRSAPTSPAKAPGRPVRVATPPLSPRKGHRVRDQVKSMIF